jgi:hypothetical protein
VSKHSSEDRTVLAYRDTGLRYLCSAQIVATAESRSITRHDGTQSHARSVRAVTRSCASPTGLTDAVVAMLALMPPPIARAAALRKMGLAA